MAEIAAGLTGESYMRGLRSFLNATDEERLLVEWIRRHWRQLMSNVGKDVRILSVGCGAGYFDLKLLDILREHLASIEYVGVDPCLEQRDSFERRFREAALGDSVKLILHPMPVEDFEPKEQFHVVHFTHCLYHIPDRVRAIRKAIEWTRAHDGRVLVFLDERRGLQTMRVQLSEMLEVPVDEVYTAEDFQRELRGAGIAYECERIDCTIDLSSCFNDVSEDGKHLLNFLANLDTAQFSESIQQSIQQFVKDNTLILQRKNVIKNGSIVFIIN